MIIPNGTVVTVSVLREILGLPGDRPDGTRDVLAIPRGDGEPVPDGASAAGPLALGGWPEIWRHDPAAGPRFLVALRGIARPYRIAGIWETDPARWGEDAGADPSRR